VSPHFGPWGFGPSENPTGTLDYRVGEQVKVLLEGEKTDYRVASVEPLRRHLPPNEECEELRIINEWDFLDLAILEAGPTVRLWLGYCCPWCHPQGGEVVFHGVTATHHVHPHTSFSEPVFRLATEAERIEHAIAAPPGGRVFCIETDDPDVPKLLIAAERVEIARCSPAPPGGDGSPSPSAPGVV
jgi:hypothetical protein